MKHNIVWRYFECIIISVRRKTVHIQFSSVWELYCQDNHSLNQIKYAAWIMFLLYQNKNLNQVSNKIDMWQK